MLGFSHKVTNNINMLNTTLPKLMTNEEKAWFAGFIDGEGYLGILKQKKKATKQQSDSLLYHPYLIITGTDEKTIRYLKELTGCGWIVKLPGKSNFKPAYQYKVTKFEDLVSLLPEIQEFLRIKQSQSKLIIEFINYRKKALIKTGRGSRNITSFAGQEENIYQELRKLNKKGAKI